MRQSLSKVIIRKAKQRCNKSVIYTLFSYAATCLYITPLIAQANQNIPTITAQQAKALKMLGQQEPNNNQIKNLRIQVKRLSDNQGQVYLGGSVSRAELLPYLTQLKDLLKDDFSDFRANQAARDRQSFHMTLLSPKEYQLADKVLVDKLLSPGVNSQISSQLNVNLIGLGKVEKNNKRTFFVIAQSSDAQLIRQRFLLQAKDFHVTLGFNPNDIYGVKKDCSTLIDLNTKL
jgi:hypothetical protein